MPTYDYRCPSCGKIFEVRHGMEEKSDQICPECNKPMERQISGGAGLIFRGPGFYITDRRESTDDSED